MPPNAPTAVEMNIRKCEQCGRLSAPAGKPCAYCGATPAAEREGEEPLTADERYQTEMWAARNPYSAISAGLTRMLRYVASLESQLLAARRENEASRAMLSRATTRLEVLQGRIAACHEAHPTEHNVSLVEIPGWIEEQRAALAAAGEGT